MSNWSECRLADVAEIVMGQSPPGDSCNTLNKGIPLLNGPTEFSGKYPTAMQYTVDAKKIARVGDILFCVRGSTTGRMNWADREYAIGRGLAAIRHKNAPAAQPFIKALLDFNLPVILGGATGSTFPNVGGEELRNLPVIIPSLPEQTAIAEILSSLDDKIDLLHRQNKTLEQLAETLFRQWFVEEAEDGTVPLGDVVSTTSGGTPSRANVQFYESGTINWVKSKELLGGYILETEERITNEAIRSSSAKILPANSVLVAMYGATVGQYAILANQASCNQAVCALIPNNEYPHTYLFMLIKWNKENLINMAVGSAQQNISQELIKELEVSSDTKLVGMFHDTVVVIFEKIKGNSRQIKSLAKLRDTLLPKLMNGEINLG